MQNSYNKNNYEQKHLHTHTVIVPESPSSSTSEVETTATSSIISFFHQSDSESDHSSDFLPPSPKQPRIEWVPEVSVVRDVAYLAKRKRSLTEREKYNFYCYHFTSDID